MGELKFRDFDAADTKQWARMSEAETNAFKKKVCRTCTHFGTTRPDSYATATCNYFNDVGRCRICSPLRCKEKGYYERRGSTKVQSEAAPV